VNIDSIRCAKATVEASGREPTYVVVGRHMYEKILVELAPVRSRDLDEIADAMGLKRRVVGWDTERLTFMGMTVVLVEGVDPLFCEVVPESVDQYMRGL
jgi:hypothetical protein